MFDRVSNKPPQILTESNKPLEASKQSKETRY